MSRPRVLVGLLLALLLAACWSSEGQQAAVSRAAGYPSGDLVVSGTVVRMDDGLGIIVDGRVVIAEGRILAVQDAGAPIPEAARDFPSVSVHGFIYPGLINAHNHLAYNTLPSWQVPQTGGQPLRTVQDWRGSRDGLSDVRDAYLEALVGPKGELMKLGLAEEVGKWAEMKELAAGTTTTQGSFGFRASGGEEDSDGFHPHLIRNLDLEDRSVRQSAVGIYERGSGQVNGDLLASILVGIEAGRTKTFLVHLSEGTTEASTRELYDLNEFRRLPAERCGPLMPRTVVVHGISYGRAEFELMAACGAHLVAAPLSNLLYYGRAPDLSLALQAGVSVSLSTDWSPVGSRNLLEELKVVDFLNQHLYGRRLDDVALVQMVTRSPAGAIGWEERAGRLEPGLLGDVLVLRRSNVADPYRSLIEATEREVALVAVGGEPLYGDVDLMAALRPSDHEVLDSGCGYRKAIDITADRAEVDQGGQDVPAVQNALVEAFRRSPSLGGKALAPLFTCADQQHFRTLAQSLTLGYFHPQLRELPHYLQQYYASH